MSGFNPEVSLCDSSQQKQWTAPYVFDMGQDSTLPLLEDVISSYNPRVIDNISGIADGLFEINNPSDKDDHDKRQAYNEKILSEGVGYGNWVFFPWDNQIVRYPSEEDHLKLRTARNKNLINDDEQTQLYDARVAVFGLSVGSHVVESLAITGIGKFLTIGDPDTISVTNLNRLRGSIADVGQHKVDHLAKRVSYIDPYIEQVHKKEGFTENSSTDRDIEDLDILVDEVDDLSAKVRMRMFAQERGIPIIMATDVGDTTIIDVERYDIEDAKPFHGVIKPKLFRSLLEEDISGDERKKIIARIVGLRNASSRLISSVVEIDRSLAGMPQLGSAAISGGALSTVAIREILLDRPLPSGRYVSSPKKNLKLKSPDKLSESLSTIYNFMKH